MKAACIRLDGEITSKTPIFLGSGRTNAYRTLEHVPGSFMRGAFGVALMKAVCVKTESINSHERCEARDGCPYFQLFRGGLKASNIIFRYAYPLHEKCPKRGTYIPCIRKSHTCELCSDDLNSRVLLKPGGDYECKGCGHVARNPVKLMKIEAGGLTNERKRFIYAIPPGTRFKFDLIIMMASGCDPCVEFIRFVLEKTLLEYGVGRWKRLGFGRFMVTGKVEEIDEADVERRADEIDASNFAVRLVSPMVLGEGKTLTPSILLEAARRAYSRIYRKAKPSLPEVKLVDKTFSYEGYGGWSLKTGKRRRLQTAISAGSVFQFKCDHADITLARALAALEHYAVGAYKPHGCGQVIIEREPGNL